MISTDLGQLPLAGPTDQEIAALIETLHLTMRRLEKLTGGEVDTVADRTGRTIMLRRAQNHLRQHEAAKQAAILNALPAQVALLDIKGRILTVNEAWRQFTAANALRYLGGEVGVDYLAICDRATGDDARQAHQIAAGIRSVLSGREPTVFAFEYYCHSPTEPRWFQSTVTPLTSDPANGAILMRRDVTAERQAVDSLHATELRFRQLAENIREVFWLSNTAKTEMLYVSPGYEAIWGRSCASLYASPRDWSDAIHPEDRERVLHSAQRQQASNEYVEEYRIIRGDGAIRWVRDRAFPICADDGEVYRIAGIAEDITERRNADQRFKDLLEIAPDALVVVNRDREMVLVNSKTIELFGWRREELLGRKIALLIPTDPDACGDAEQRRRATGAQPGALARGAGRELSGLRKDGTTFLAEIRVSPLETDEGTWEMSAIRDISERKAAEHRIAELTRVYAMLSGINTLIVRVSGRDELFQATCRIAVDAGGFRMALICLINRRPRDIVPVAWAGMDTELITAIKDRLASKDGASHTMIGRAIRDKHPVISNVVNLDPRALLREQHTEARVRSLAVLPLLVADEAVGVLALYAHESEFFRDEEMTLLTELSDDIAFAINHIDQQERLAYLAYYDGLTGLANRRLFTDRLAQYVRAAASNDHKLALFILDLERFRNINASLGRPAGDALLKQVAHWLTKNAADATFVARLDADHFAVLLPTVTPGGNLGRLLDKKMTAFLKHPFLLNDTLYRIAAKVGAALFPNDGDDADTLLKNAEATVKKAKVTGDRYLFYAHKADDTMTGSLDLENRLRQAVDNHEFVLHYQPKMNLVSGELTGAEALLRWNDPQGGLVLPGQFIRILEETGMIKEVGLWALHAAIVQHLRWRSAGLRNPSVAVNVSALQLRSPAFVADIANICASNPDAAAGLELEITESVIMDDVKQSVVTLREIRALGVSITIDDFGTGFSSLNYLAKLPVDTLKIDRSFVSNYSPDSAYS